MPKITKEKKNKRTNNVLLSGTIIANIIINTSSYSPSAFEKRKTSKKAAFPPNPHVHSNEREQEYQILKH